MEKAARIKQLIEARTALLGAVAGLCDDDFETAFGDRRLSLKKRLAHIAVVDWDVARGIREISQGSRVLAPHQLPTSDWSEGKIDLVEPRCCSSSNEIMAEVVLSLQALLDELRSLPEEHFLTIQTEGPGSTRGAASLVDVALRCTQQHHEEFLSWRGE